LALDISFWNFFRASKINKVELTLFGWIFFDVFLVDVYDEDGMTSGAPLIHSCEGNFPIACSTVHGFEHLLPRPHADLCTVLYEDTPVLILFDF